MGKRNDLTDQQFGELTVIKKHHEKFSEEDSWVCKCSCGKYTTADTRQLQYGRKKSCGCLRRKAPSNALNLAGEKFGKLTVIKRAGVTAYGRALWLCKCECGKMTEANATCLKLGEIVSCGCLKEQQIKHARTSRIEAMSFCEPRSW